MTSQEAKQHIKKAQENPEEYHFEWFFDEDGDEVELDEPEDFFQTASFKSLHWTQRLWIRIKIAFWLTLQP